MNKYLPNGMLGIALTGLMASFMAGVAANVSAFNTVVTTDIVEPYIQRDRPDEYYVRVGRIVTIAGMIVAIGTALIASGYSNLMNYLQALFSIFNAPLFATFIIGMFWKRSTPAAGFLGLVAGTIAALVTYIGYKWAGWFTFGSDLDESFWGAGAAFVIDARRHRRGDPLHQAQARRGAAGPRVGHGQRRRERPQAQVVGIATAAGLQRARHRRRPDHRLLVGARSWLKRTGATTS